MLLVAYSAIFLSLACIALALMPKASLSMPSFGGSSSVRPLIESSRGQRRMPLSGLFSFFGKFLSRAKAGDETSSVARMIYTGSRVSKVEFAGIKMLCGLAGAFAGMVLLKELGMANPMLALIAGVVAYSIPAFWLKSRIGNRQKAIVRLLPEIIDLLALCIGAGLDFLMALNKVISLKRFQKEPLIEELAVALQEIKFGKRRAEALKSMAKRLNLPELSSFVRTVVQADRMGTPIGEVLAVHSQDVRAERLIKAERIALKAPIKILFPLIFFIMPCVGIIVGAPIFIQFMNQSPFGK